MPPKNDIVKWLWRLFFLFIAVNVVAFLLMSSGLIGYLPRIDELENPIDKYASQVISSDDQLLFTYSQSDENRIFVSYYELSPDLIHALVATEDRRYYNHSGIDFIGLGRAVFKTLLLQDESSGGGSTITQQLAKLLYSPKANNKLQRVFQKPIEWVIATKLERFYTKDEIINLYLNKYDFNYNAVGIESAARTYFNKRPIDLNIQESAMLVGMLKNSSLYNPVRRENVTKERRDVVLAQMRKAGHLTLQEADPFRYRHHDHRTGFQPCRPRCYSRSLLSPASGKNDDGGEARKEKLCILARTAVYRRFARVGDRSVIRLVQQKQEARRFKL